MKKTILLILLFFVVLTNCDGRKSNNNSLSESVQEFNKDFKAEVITYQPKDYIEIEVDTLLSNGYNVKIKTYTDLNNSVVFSKIVDTINYKTYHRNYKFDIRVEKHGKLIFKETFDKVKANKKMGYKSNLATDSPLYNFNELAILKSITVDDEPSIKECVMINLMYAIPNTKRYASHTLFINDNGTSNAVHVKIN